MTNLETKLALEQDESEARDAAGQFGATLERDQGEPNVYWLTMQPPSEATETFFARIAWTTYPHAPPSVKFADAIGGRLDLSSSWPLIPGYRPGERDICQPFTAEGHALHQDWSQGPEAWSGTGNPFLWVVLQMLHGITDRYQGRSG